MPQGPDTPYLEAYRAWLSENKNLLASYEEFGVRFDACEGCWKRILGTPAPPSGMIVPLPPSRSTVAMVDERDAALATAPAKQR